MSNLCLVPGVKKNVAILQKDLHVNREDICFLYGVEKQKLKKMEDTWLWSNYEEADTKMISHVWHLVASNNVVVRTVHTDVLALVNMANIIALANMEKRQCLALNEA